MNHITKQAQYEHPSMSQYQIPSQEHMAPPLGPKPVYSQPPAPLAHVNNNHNMLVPANPYLHEEIPIWLRVYFKASPTLDHKLKWDLFRLPELECFDAMLNRLLRDELEELVMRYEGIRCAISQEIEYRQGCIKVSYNFLPPPTFLVFIFFPKISIIPLASPLLHLIFFSTALII